MAREKRLRHHPIDRGHRRRDALDLGEVGDDFSADRLPRNHIYQKRNVLSTGNVGGVFH